MSLPFELALRFLSGGRGSILRTSSGVAFFGMAIGTSALVVAMGLMSGYRADLADALAAGNGEILLYDTDRGVFAEADNVRDIVMKIDGVESSAAIILQPGFAFAGDSHSGTAAVLKGIDSADPLPPALLRRVPDFAPLDAVAPGELPPAIVGAELARQLSVKVGDAFRVLVPDLSAENQRPRSASFRVQSTFQTGFAQYDAEWFYVDRSVAQRVLRLAGDATCVELRLKPRASLDDVLTALDRGLPPTVRSVDWRSLNASLFAALTLQQRALFVGLALIVGAAAFNLGSSLHTLATGRTRDIGLLIACGARRSQITRLFLWCGVLLGGAGTAAGIGFGAAVCALLTHFRAIRFPPDMAEVYFVSWIPFRPQPLDLAAVAIVALLLAALASITPAVRAAGRPAAQSLRYE